MQVQKVIFLYKAVKGAAGASFGLNVAMMAGLPHTVVAKASGIARRCQSDRKKPLNACETIQSDNCGKSAVTRLSSELCIDENVLEALKAALSLPESCGADIPMTKYQYLQQTVRQHLGRS